MSYFDNIMTTNPTNFYYQQYHPSSQSPLLQPTTNNTDLNKLDKDSIYKYEKKFFCDIDLFFLYLFSL